MKTATTLTLLAILGTLACSVTSAQPAPGDEPAPPGRPPQGRPDPEMRRKALLKKYDANKDGKLDEAEFAALGKDMFEGKLQPPARGPGGPDGPGGPGGPGFGPRGHGGDGTPGFGGPPPGEFPQHAWRAPGKGEMEDGGDQGRPPFRPGQRGFGPPDSQGGRKGLEERRSEFLKKYDANGDGKLDSAEREQIGKDIEEGKLPPPPMRPNAPPNE